MFLRSPVKFTIFYLLHFSSGCAIYIYDLIKYTKLRENSLKINSDKHNNYNLRNNSLLNLPFHRLTTTQNSALYKGIQCFNKLNDDIKSITNFTIFKRKVLEFLNNKCYYSVREFLCDTQ